MNNVGDFIDAGNANWMFSGAVGEKFDDHVERSVPWYHEGHKIIQCLSDFFLRNDSLCYDLGCSTGKLVYDLAQHQKDKNIRFVAIDITRDMVAKARKRCWGMTNVQIVESDIDIDFEPCDMIISYYTLQFTHPSRRHQIVNKIYKALRQGGSFVFFEKVRAPNALFQDILSAVYVDFKLCQGYSYEQILAKERSLKGQLIPFTSKQNQELLAECGFQDVMPIMKYVNFEGLLAIK